MSSSPVIGQERAMALLRASLAAGRLAHAYLIVGPPQVGKGTLARFLAQAVNCPSPGPPCGQCPSCQRIELGRHADVVWLAPERKEIGIDRVRELERQASLHPFEGRCRVFIIDGAQDLSQEAANALLKTLEEPPPQVLLLLLATSEEGLLPTLRSRCQRLELVPLPLARVEEALLAKGVSPGEARLLARLSAGRLGWALATAREGLEKRRRALEGLRELPRASLGRRLTYAAEVARLDRGGLASLLELWRGWWRDLMLLKAGGQAFLRNEDYREVLSKTAEEFSLGQAAAFLSRIRETEAALADNANPRLALENLLLTLPYPLVKEF